MRSLIRNFFLFTVKRPYLQPVFTAKRLSLQPNACKLPKHHEAAFGSNEPGDHRLSSFKHFFKHFYVAPPSGISTWRSYCDSGAEKVLS